MNKVVDSALATAPVQDLREWLDRVEKIGELVRVDKAVDRDEEMSAISYLLAKQDPSPAVLFDRTAGCLRTRSRLGPPCARRPPPWLAQGPRFPRPSPCRGTR